MALSAFVTDRIRGAIYGQAIGDALGLGTEFLTRDMVKQYYPLGLTRYGQIIRDEHTKRWPIGAWTDDTDQMLCILDSLLDKGHIDVLDIAHKLYHWVTQGGMGIGKTVLSVLFAPEFLSDPHQAAKNVWEQSGRYLAANGGVMRTSILGVWDYEHPERVKANAEQVCQITHYDPRCVGSCVLVCLAISALLRGQTDVEDIIQQAYMQAAAYDLRISAYLDQARESLEALNLDEGLDPDTGNMGKIGYTLKALGAGFWALKHATSYMDGILQVIHQGGDADSNAAVAGALLGARFGFSHMPHTFAQALAGSAALETRIERLVQLMSGKKPVGHA